MCKKLSLFLVLAIALSDGAVWAAVPITVENYSFEIPPYAGRNVDANVGKPGVLTGWTRVDQSTTAHYEAGWTPVDGSLTLAMNKNAEIFNWTGQKVGTDFLAMDGDTFRLQFWARSTWHGDNLAAYLFYTDDAGNRVVFATTNIDLWNKSTMTQYTLDSNAVGLATREHRVGIQFKHTRVKSTDDNTWAGLDLIQLWVTSPPDEGSESLPGA